MDIEQNEKDFSPAQSLKLIANMIEKVQDDKLRRLAKKRVSFKKSVIVVIFISLMIVLIWYFTTGIHSYFWPIWPLIGFAFWLLIQFLEAYLGAALFSEDKEYEKLKLKLNK